MTPNPLQRAGQALIVARARFAGRCAPPREPMSVSVAVRAPAGPRLRIHRGRALVALGSLLGAACTHTVVPPSDPQRPTAAFLLDHGRHASLVLEREAGLVRYTYGDWSYYARNRTGTLRASGTLFGSNRAALGRKAVPGEADVEAVKRRVLVPVEAAWHVEVARARALALGHRLDAIFREGAAGLTYNPLYDLEFVPHPEAYHVGHNSNHVTGEWLRALGCRVRLRGPFSDWRVAGTGPSGAASSPSADAASPAAGH